jgi:hypothetical protein
MHIFFSKLKPGCQPHIEAPSGKVVRDSEGTRDIILVRDCFYPRVGNDIPYTKQVKYLSTDPYASEIAKRISILQAGILPFKYLGKTDINPFV